MAMFFVILLPSSPAHAAQTVPYKMNFQGRLTDSTGMPVTGSYDMQFKLYTAVTGGTYIWGETRTAANGNAVTVTKGLFSILIGEGTAVSGSSASLQAAVAANQTMYMEVTVGTDTLSPRNQFGSGAYAINADMVDGIDGASLGQLSVANSWTAAQNVTVASTNAFQVKNGSTNLFNVDTSGSIISLGTSDTTGVVLVLDTKTSAGDPTGASATVGAMYYNSNLGKFRCYQVSAWTDCIGANYALSNLTTTSINQSLIASSSNAIDLGSSGTTWRNGYFGTSLTAATSVVTPAIRPVSDSATALQIQNAAGTSTFLALNTASSQIEIGSSSLAGKLAVSDGSSNFATLTVSALAGNYTVNIPTITANDTICLQSNANCVSTLQVAYNASTGGTTPEIKVNSTKGGVTIQDADTTIAGTLFSVTQSNASGLGTALLSVGSTGTISLGLAGAATTLPGNISATGTLSATGSTVLLKPSSSASNAFQIQNSSSLAFISADTAATIVRIGSSSTADSTVLLVMDYGSSDPTGVNGGEYYNSTNNKFRCYQGGIWQDCGNGFNTVTKTADQIATTSSTTFQDDNTLYFAVNANTTYVFDAWIPVNDSNTTADLKYTFTIPTGGTIAAISNYFTSTSLITNCNIITSGQTCANTGYNNANHFIQVRGTVAVGGTAGTVRFRFAQNGSSTASFPIIKKGATLSWHQSN